MVDAKVRESEDAIEASGDAIVVAEAIFAGLCRIAESVDRLAKVFSEDTEQDEPENLTSYMDGSSR